MSRIKVASLLLAYPVYPYFILLRFNLDCLSRAQTKSCGTLMIATVNWVITELDSYCPRPV